MNTQQLQLRDECLKGLRRDAKNIFTTVLEVALGSQISLSQCEELAGKAADCLATRVTETPWLGDAITAVDLRRSDGTINAKGIVEALETAVAQYKDSPGRAFQIKYLADHARNTFSDCGLPV